MHPLLQAFSTTLIFLSKKPWNPKHLSAPLAHAHETFFLLWSFCGIVNISDGFPRPWPWSRLWFSGNFTLLCVWCEPWLGPFLGLAIIFQLFFGPVFRFEWLLFDSLCSELSLSSIPPTFTLVFPTLSTFRTDPHFPQLIPPPSFLYIRPWFSPIFLSLISCSEWGIRGGLFLIRFGAGALWILCLLLTCLIRKPFFGDQYQLSTYQLLRLFLRFSDHISTSIRFLFLTVVLRFDAFYFSP